MIRLSSSILLSLLVFVTSTCVCAQIQVTASIKPIHSLVASVMLGVGKPTLIIDGASSPHTYALRPSQAKLLSRADVVFWVGQELETFLEKPIATIAAKAKTIELLHAPGLKKLPLRGIKTFSKFSHQTNNYSKKKILRPLMLTFG